MVVVDKGRGVGGRLATRRIGDATFDHGVVTGDTITGTYEEANDTLNALEGLGVSYNEVVALLESEGLEKFVASWKELLNHVQDALDAAGKVA